MLQISRLPVGRLAKVVDDRDVLAEVGAELDTVLAHFVGLEQESCYRKMVRVRRSQISLR